MSLCLHLANLLYLASYSVRDILKLRIITVIAILLMIPHYYFFSHDYWAIFWNLLFGVINLVRIQMLLRERRPPKLTAKQQRLHELAFHRLTPREMLRLLTHATWVQAARGDVIVPEHVELDHLLLVFSGRARVYAEGRVVAEIGPGDFVGEMSFLSQGRTSARVVAAGDVELVSWSKDQFHQYLDRNTELRSAMLSVIGLDLVHKLVELRQRVEGETDPSAASAGLV